MKIQACFLVCALVLTPTAWADDCPVLITQIDEILAAKPDLDEETIVDEDLRKSVKQLREEGEKLYKEGKHDECVMALEKALDMLEEETG